jgi:hypothetical protein
MMENKKIAIIGFIVILVIILGSYFALNMIVYRFGPTNDKNFCTRETCITNNKKIVNEINNWFTKPDEKLAIAPSIRAITLKQGDSEKGFAFSVRNNLNDTQIFTWKIFLDENYEIRTKCPGLTVKEADSWLIIGEGSFSLAGGAKMENPELVKFTIPENAPPCVLPYKIEIRTGSTPYISGKVYVTIEKP